MVNGDEVHSRVSVTSRVREHHTLLHLKETYRHSKGIRYIKSL